MSVRIEIDKHGSVFTCLDIITGRVILNVEKNTQETVSSINVKLEGVSKTKLLVPKEGETQDSRNKKAQIEIHKVLYLVETVFPPPEIQKSQKEPGGSETGFTIPAGTHIYPFKFRIPVNNSCRPLDSLFSKLSIEDRNFEFIKDAEYHIRNTLPPSLHSLPGGSHGEGGFIRYFVKATVNRPQFYRTNLRKEAAFAFLPVDPPPRPAPQAEIFARREHLLHFPVLPRLLPQKKSFWGRSKKVETPIPPEHPAEEPRFTIEARLPAPAVLVPKKPLGLRIIMVKRAPFLTPVVLRQLQLRLFMTTYITAHGHSKKVTLTIPLFSTNSDYRLGMPIPHIFGPVDAEPGILMEADKAIWEGWMLPESISPSFRTCNITMEYQLEITIGVSLGETGNVDQIPLVIPLEIYTGLTPPDKLLAAANVSPNKLEPDTKSQPAQPCQPSKKPPLAQPSQPCQKPPPARRDQSLQHLRVNSYPSSSSSPLASSSRPTSATFPNKPFNANSHSTPSPITLQVPYPQSYRTSGYDSAASAASPLPSPASSTFPTPSPSSPYFPSHDQKESDIWQPVQTQQTMDAPPTYEDAVLREIDDVDIMVADGPRREYPLQPGYYSDEHSRDTKRASRLFG